MNTVFMVTVSMDTVFMDSISIETVSMKNASFQLHLWAQSRGLFSKNWKLGETAISLDHIQPEQEIDDDVIDITSWYKFLLPTVDLSYDVTWSDLRTGIHFMSNSITWWTFQSRAIGQFNSIYTVIVTWFMFSRRYTLVVLNSQETSLRVWYFINITLI